MCSTALYANKTKDDDTAKVQSITGLLNHQMMLPVAQCKIIHDNLQNGELASNETRKRRQLNEASERSNRGPSVKPNQSSISPLHV